MKKLFTLMLVVVACSGDDDPKSAKVPQDLYERRINEFYAEVTARGVNLPIITPTVVYAPENKFQLCDGAPGLTNSYKDGDKYIIRIRETAVINNDNSMLVPIFREMAHLLLDKPYSEEEYYFPVNEDPIFDIMYRCDHSPTISSTDDPEMVKAMDYLFQ